MTRPITPGPAVELIERAAGIIAAKRRESGTAPYHWAAALYEAGMLPGSVPVATPPEPTRFVLVDWRPGGVGRMLDAAGVGIRLERQDDGRTLKVFLTGPVATPTEPEPLCEECCDGKHQRCPEQPGCCCARRLDAASPVPAGQPVDEVVCPSCGTRIRARMSTR